MKPRTVRRATAPAGATTARSSGLLRLQQVFAKAPDRDSRIRDDQDERQPRFFQRQILVDIQDEDRAGAWRGRRRQLARSASST